MMSKLVSRVATRAAIVAGVRCAAAQVPRRAFTASAKRQAQAAAATNSVLAAHDVFAPRHLGSSTDADIQAMLKVIGMSSLEELISKTVPGGIRTQSAHTRTTPNHTTHTRGERRQPKIGKPELSLCTPYEITFHHPPMLMVIRFHRCLSVCCLLPGV